MDARLVRMNLDWIQPSDQEPEEGVHVLGYWHDHASALVVYVDEFGDWRSTADDSPCGPPQCWAAYNLPEIAQ